MFRSPSIPLVVASVNTTDDLEALPSIDLEKTCHILEFRLDGVGKSPDCRKSIATCGLPVILTARCPDEGAFAEIALPDRLQMLHSLLVEECYVDLECSTLVQQPDNSAVRDLLDQMVEKNGKLIASFHDFSGVPNQENVETKISIAREYDAILKIACTVNTTCELSAWTERLAQLLAADCAFSFMGMGKYGMATRLTAASAGSLLNYGYLHKPSVSGQWPAESLVHTLSLLAQ